MQTLSDLQLISLMLLGLPEERNLAEGLKAFTDLPDVCRQFVTSFLEVVNLLVPFLMA